MFKVTNYENTLQGLCRCIPLPSDPPSTHTITSPAQCTLPRKRLSGRRSSSMPFSPTSTCCVTHASIFLHYLGLHQQLGAQWIFILRCVEHARRFVIWTLRFTIWWLIYETKISICGSAKIDSQLLTQPLPIKLLYIGMFEASSTSII
jgi:hypothetical protein